MDAIAFVAFMVLIENTRLWAYWSSTIAGKIESLLGLRRSVQIGV